MGGQEMSAASPGLAWAGLGFVLPRQWGWGAGVCGELPRTLWGLGASPVLTGCPSFKGTFCHSGAAAHHVVRSFTHSFIHPFT